MDVAGIVNIILPIVFCLVGVALIVFIIELVKLLKSVRGTVDNLAPTMKNIEDITTNIQPTLAKVDPLMDRVQLTVDSVNLEMMRVDQILEDVSDITGSASSATAAVDNITNAPLKAVSNVADRVRTAFGPKNSSDESAQLGSRNDSVEKALEDYKAAEELDAKADAGASEAPKPEADSEAPASYVKEPADGEEPVIDPKVIAESPFFDEDPDAK